MRRKAKKVKLADLDRVVGECKYCKKLIYSQESFVVFATKEYAHYACMKADDESKHK